MGGVRGSRSTEMTHHLLRGQMIKKRSLWMMEIRVARETEASLDGVTRIKAFTLRASENVRAQCQRFAW